MARAFAPLLALAALAAAGCSADCPAGTSRDEGRAARLAGLLADTPAASLALPTVCFGEVAEPALGEDDLARLPGGLRDAEAAAWLAHLAHHRAHGRPTRHFDGGPCDDALALARADEAAALTLEAQVRERLGAPALDADARLTRVLAGYRTRCR